MPQLHLPLYPQGVTQISDSLSFLRKGDDITYYHYDLPVFTHAENDLATFRMVTSQFFVNGHVTQAQISRIFGVPLVTVKRAVKRFRDEGPFDFLDTGIASNGFEIFDGVKKTYGSYDVWGSGFEPVRKARGGEGFFFYPVDRAASRNGRLNRFKEIFTTI